MVHLVFFYDATDTPSSDSRGRCWQEVGSGLVNGTVTFVDGARIGRVFGRGRIEGEVGESDARGGGGEDEDEDGGCGRGDWCALKLLRIH